MNSTNTPSCLYWHTGGLECRTSTDCVCVICISFPRLAQRPGLSLFYDFYDPNVSSSVGHGVPRCKPLTPTHYLHSPHRDQSVRL